jgi:4-hydroxy-4-methyl-2-oxoglutarate aldolase
MDVRPGDLLHGDQHGVLTIPAEIAAEVPDEAADLEAQEKKVIEFCRSEDFSVAKLWEITRSVR